jgi:eukaryotic-like serine/threonine-protein kinase
MNDHFIVSPPTPPQSTDLPGSDEDLTGKTICDFQILRRLGQGGMGQFYLAEQISIKRKVAVMFLKPEITLNETSLRRFQSEVRNLAQLNHANIVKVYSIGQIGHLHYMAMEFVEGMNLPDYLAKRLSDL